MFFSKVLTLAALAATFVSATSEPDPADLDAVVQTFSDAGIDMGVPVDLDSLVFITFIDSTGAELVTVTGPGEKVDPRLAQNEPSVATQGVPHVMLSRLVAALIDIDNNNFVQFLAWNLSVREDSAFVDHGSHLLNNNVTHTPAADAFLGPDPAEGTGLHRFVYLVWRQPGTPLGPPAVDGSDFEFVVPDDRENFDVVTFANEAGLPPVNAMTFFTAEFQGPVSKFRN